MIKDLFHSPFFRVLAHIVFWMLFTLIPIGLAGDMSMDFNRTLQHSLIRTGSFAAIFYFNYLWLADRFFNQKKMLVFILANVVFFSLLIWVKELFFSYVTPPSNANLPKPKDNIIIYMDFLLFCVPAAIAVVLKTSRRLTEVQIQQAKDERNLLQYELQYLRYQLHPHFFFNSLNNIYALIDINSDRAKETVHSLSKLMRYMLYRTDTERVDLKEEVDFIEQYIELMKLRVRENTSIEIDFPKNIPPLKIAPLLFISIVENAFKHGISATGPSELSFALNIDGNRITFTSENTNIPKTEQDKSGSGIGIENLKKRLELLYEDRFGYTYTIKDGKYFSTLWVEDSEEQSVIAP